MQSITANGTKVELTPAEEAGKARVQVDIEHPKGHIQFCSQNYGEMQGQKGIIGHSRKFGQICVTVPEEDFSTVFEQAKNRIREKIEAVKSGEESIELMYKEGEPLSGYMPKGLLVSDLLVELGIAEEITGWGVRVKPEAVEKLGINFSYNEAAEYAKTQARTETQEEYFSPEDEDRPETITQPVEKMETTTETVVDEGGRTVVATHIVTLKNGCKYTFNDRNIFDFGRVINPAYAVIEGVEPGGLHNRREDGTNIWMNYIDREGWKEARELSEDELAAFLYVRHFGYHAKADIRM